MTKSLADKLSKQPTVAEELAAHQEKTVTRATKEKYKAALAEIARLKDQVGALLALDQKPRPVLPRLPATREKGRGATVILGLSDWHVEEIVDPKKVSGLNSFDISIAEKSVKATFENFLHLLENERGLTKIEHGVIWLGGDHISGYLHPELQETNALSPSEAVLFAADLIEWGLRYVCRFSGLKTVSVVTNHGNHGRTTEKSRISSGAENSFEWLMYHMLAKMLRDEKKLGWQIADGYLNYLDVEGHPVRFSHGDAIKFAGGVGGLTIPVNKAISQWNKSRRAYLDVMGHLHTWMQLPSCLMNGSVIGYGAYSLFIKADYQEPCQMMAVMDAKRGLTKAMKVYCR
jgi:hypothetical protein